MNTKKLPELLAPAGTLDAFKTAILYGADAIYAGLPGFSMRARAKIDVEGVRQGIELAHSAGKKVYLAFNLFAHDFEYANMPRVADVIKYFFAILFISSTASSGSRIIISPPNPNTHP